MTHMTLTSIVTPTLSRLLLAVALGACASAASAQQLGELYPQDTAQHVDTASGSYTPKTRAQVVAEVIQARKDGSLRRSGDISQFDLDFLAPPVHDTRAHVRAELIEAKRDGSFDTRGEVSQVELGHAMVHSADHHTGPQP